MTMTAMTSLVNADVKLELEGCHVRNACQIIGKFYSLFFHSSKLRLNDQSILFLLLGASRQEDARVSEELILL